MNVTVILCTHNRCESLARALDSLAHSLVPESVKWEVLVVDNNSSDGTAQTVHEFCRLYCGRFRYARERQQGKSFALNTGIRESQGEVLAFVDDDVIVEPTWLHSLTAPLLNGECAGSGGRILPQGSFSPPNWFPAGDRFALATLALFDLGTDVVPLKEPPFGTNMAFRKDVFEKFGSFRTDLGPRPDSEIRGEDSELASRLIAAGERLLYLPSAVVYHEMPEHRIKKQYFLTWAFDKGRSERLEFGVPKDTKWFIAGIPLLLFRRLAFWTFRWLIAFDLSRRFSNRLKVWWLFGFITECHRRSGEPAEPGTTLA